MEKEEESFVGFESFITSFTLGTAEKHRNLAIFPIYSTAALSNGYILLQDALKTGKFTVAEVDESGTVPNLRVINELEEAVLILDGDALVGAKQNRIVNTTIIIGRRQEIIIPVSCVEQGRWRRTGRGFKSGKFNLYSALRKKKTKSVTRNLRVSASFSSNQGEIWSDISEKQMRFSVRSNTGDMHDIYEENEKELKSYEQAFTPKRDQVGFIAAIDNQIVGCDIFGTKKVLPRVYQRLLGGYILDAIDKDIRREKSPAETEEVSKASAEAFIKGLKTIKRERFKSVGEGDDVRLESDCVNGFALVHRETVVHMAAFAE